ncbi:unnamed protein product [Adineta steineri]|uniref:Thioredoxin domain-containing protein 17 n=1 Tax=Adineta steineri TaxID=433720 RepID=A0A814T2X0_9BILA|nr:unnamed protein product [Adineta steineri]
MTSSVSVAGFDQLKNTVEKYDKDKRIFVLFCGTKDSKGHSWCPDCVAAEKPVEEAVKSSLPSNAVFIECDAGKLALERGWAINIGGGFHHCSSDSGGGFCAYADLTLLIKNLFIYYSDRIKKVLIVDLDAHQGNGHEHDFMNDERVFIMDMYNSQIYPRDQHAKTAIKCKIELMNHTDDKTYLRLLHINLEKSLKEFQPDFVVYNAGTDILEGDLLGNLDITPEGVIIRDEIVFSKCIRERNIPIVMCTSGGYQRTNARVIADSILNLNRKELISCE